MSDAELLLEIAAAALAYTRPVETEKDARRKDSARRWLRSALDKANSSTALSEMVRQVVDRREAAETRTAAPAFRSPWIDGPPSNPTSLGEVWTGTTRSADPTVFHREVNARPIPVQVPPRAGKVKLFSADAKFDRSEPVADRLIGYACQGCSRVYGWNDEKDLTYATSTVEIKTIASRYCVNCIDAEARAHGIPRDRVIAMRMKSGQPVPPPHPSGQPDLRGETGAEQRMRHQLHDAKRLAQAVVRHPKHVVNYVCAVNPGCADDCPTCLAERFLRDWKYT